MVSCNAAQLYDRLGAGAMIGGVSSLFAVIGELARDIYSLTPGAKEKEFYREVFFNCRLRVGRSNDPCSLLS